MVRGISGPGGENQGEDYPCRIRGMPDALQRLEKTACSPGTGRGTNKIQDFDDGWRIQNAGELLGCRTGGRQRPGLFVWFDAEFGIDSPDRTQVNMGFNPDAVLFDQWRCWFEWTWGQAAPLTEVTAEIPALVPAVGEPKAGAQWLAYCAVCEDASSKRIIGSSEQSANITVDSSTGDVSCDMESDGLGSTTEQTPTEALKLPKLDGLERRICQLVATGQQVTIAHSSAVPPLDVPINQSIFGLKTEQRDGTVVERRSFRISVFSKEELKKINAYRKGSQRLVEQLGLPLETGVYWLPNEVASILEKEIEAKNKEAQKQLKDMVGEDAGNFVQKKIDRINRDLEEVYRRLNNYGSLPGYAVTDIRSELEQRIGRALGGQLVAPVTFSKISFDLQEKGSSQAPWAQPEKLVLALARFPRAAISRPKTLSGLLAPQSEILPAMNVADDAILKVNNWRKRESRAQSELRPLERIVRADIDSRARCEAGFMLIDGKSPSVIEEFLAKKESARREPAQ